MGNYGANPPEERITVTTAVAIDRDKNSQYAVRYAVENLRLKEKMIFLVHVTTQDMQSQEYEGRPPSHSENTQLFLPYRGFCGRKGVRTKEVILHDIDIPIALSEFISANSIKNIVLGTSSRGAIARAFKNADVATSVGKFAPDFCSVYAVSKGKAQKIKSSTDYIPSIALSSDVSANSPVFSREESMRGAASKPSSLDGSFNHPIQSADGSDCQENIPTERPIGSSAPSPAYSTSSNESMHSFEWEKRQGEKYPSPPESVYVSFESPTADRNWNSPENSLAGDDECKISSPQQSVNYLYALDHVLENWPHYMMESSDRSELQSYTSDISYELIDEPRISISSRCSTTSSISAELEDELKKMKLELKQITHKYNAACHESVIAREKVRDIAHWRSDEVSKIVEAKQTEAAMTIVDKEKQKCKAAIELVQKARIMAEFESEKRKRAEWKFKIESKEKQQVLGALAACSLVQYRRYSIDELESATNYFCDSGKIGGGSYGPVYKATIDHTPVAIKVLKSDISEGLKQFQQEVEVLSRMRHPNMVILLGACPEYGCLVYEYMENGSLDDRLFCQDGSTTLPWPTRFAIAAEIATALNFLHQTKPQPLVHRDLKPANILLDKNFVSKISDVGLSRLVPPSVADSITEYLITAAAGTFCYIDPEYQQTGLLGTKSDIYSLGIVLLQIITAMPPMGLTHKVKRAIETGRFVDILDQSVNDWPVEETLHFAKLALNCSELRRKDRPSLGSVILPELEWLREFGSQFKSRRRLERYKYSRCPSYQESSSSFDHLEMSSS
ncbi:hypothetical protein ACS0TY_012789 [Phlomoides rotata]